MTFKVKAFEFSLNFYRCSFRFDNKIFMRHFTVLQLAAFSRGGSCYFQDALFSYFFVLCLIILQLKANSGLVIVQTEQTY